MTWINVTMSTITELEAGPNNDGGCTIVASTGNYPEKDRVALILTDEQRAALRRELDRPWVDREGFGSTLRRIN